MAVPNAPQTYTYPQASSLATRTLLRGEAPSGVTASSASHDHEAASSQQHPLQSTHQSRNYEQAVSAAAAKQDAADSNAGSKPLLERQQSWKMQDLKREKHQDLIAAATAVHDGQNYSSTGGGAGA